MRSQNVIVKRDIFYLYSAVQSKNIVSHTFCENFHSVQMFESSKGLLKVAVYGAFGVSAFGLLTQRLTQNNIRNSLCYKEALECLRNHPEAQRQLGQPIKDGRINLGDTAGNHSTGNKMWYKVPITGPNSHGYMTYCVTEVNESDRKFKVTRIELDLHHIKDKKLLIKNEESK